MERALRCTRSPQPRRHARPRAGHPRLDSVLLQERRGWPGHVWVPGFAYARPGRQSQLSMQSEFAADRLEFGRLDELAVRDAHRVQRPFEFLLPKAQETMQLGKLGEKIIVLPDVGLQQPAMIGTPIQYVRGRQAITTDLFTEIL